MSAAMTAVCANCGQRARVRGSDLRLTPHGDDGCVGLAGWLASTLREAEAAEPGSRT